jgi:hypothetical protein
MRNRYIKHWKLLAVVVFVMIVAGAGVLWRLHSQATGGVGDLNGDGQVDVFDLSIMLSAWGQAGNAADLNGDGTVNIFDLSVLLSHWGPVPITGFVPMTAPEYPGSTWTATNLTTDDGFQSLANWNYGIGGSQSCSPLPTSCNYYPWWASGTAPNYGGGLAPAHVSNYDVPGNVSQTSSSPNTSLFNSYTPQKFASTGWGVTFTGHYNSSPQTYSVNGVSDQFHWTSGSLNSFNKVYFPTGTHKSFYVQFKAQMMGQGATVNGAWNAIWLLGQGNGARELDLQETGICGQNANLFCSNIQDPSSTIVDYNSSQNLSTGYHIYGIEYNGTTGVVNFYLDNQLRGSTTQVAGAGPYYILLDGEIGNGFAGASAPANNIDMTMNLMQVQVYQR